MKIKEFNKSFDIGASSAVTISIEVTTPVNYTLVAVVRWILTNDVFSLEAIKRPDNTHFEFVIKNRSGNAMTNEWLTAVVLCVRNDFMSGSW